MPTAKVAISIDDGLLKEVDRLVKARVFRSRSEAFQLAVREKMLRLDRSRLVRECAKLKKRQERAFAEEGISAEFAEWPA